MKAALRPRWSLGQVDRRTHWSKLKGSPEIWAPVIWSYVSFTSYDEKKVPPNKEEGLSQNMTVPAASHWLTFPARALQLAQQAPGSTGAMYAAFSKC